MPQDCSSEPKRQCPKAHGAFFYKMPPGVHPRNGRFGFAQQALVM
jgi:hypothetical protein